MNDHIIKAAKAAGGTTYTNRHHDGTACAFGPEALERFYAIAYRAGLEDAAKVAEGQQDIAEQEKADKRFKDAIKEGDERNAVDRGEHWMCVTTCNAVLRNAAKAIRSLKEQQHG